MYNEAIKEEFLSNYNEETQSVYRNVLSKAESEEMRLNSDLYDFNLSEIKRVMYNISPQTFKSSQMSGAVISSYISWAIGRGLRSSNINPMGDLKREYFEQFVQNVQLFYSEEEIIELEDTLVNYQDQVIIRLLFEGVTVKELLNLTEDDIDYNQGKLLLREDDQVRELYLWEETRDRSLKIIKEATWQEIYYSKNGSDPYMKRREIPLVEADFVVKKSNSNPKGSPQARYHVISNRFDVIKEVLGDYYTINPTRLAQSGMIKMGKDLLLRDGELEKNQYLEIAKRFKRNTTIEYSAMFQLRQIVNKEIIQKVYPDIDFN